MSENDLLLRQYAQLEIIKNKIATCDDQEEKEIYCRKVFEAIASLKLSVEITNEESYRSTLDSLCSDQEIDSAIKGGRVS